MTETRITVVVLGRHLGYASGWDGDPGDAFWFYDFEPAEGTGLLKCDCFNIDLNKGEITPQDREGNAIDTTRDIATFCAGLPIYVENTPD